MEVYLRIELRLSAYETLVLPLDEKTFGGVGAGLVGGVGLGPGTGLGSGGEVSGLVVVVSVISAVPPVGIYKSVNGVFTDSENRRGRTKRLVTPTGYLVHPLGIEPRNVRM